jgi:hypothetical protein
MCGTGMKEEVEMCATIITTLIHLILFVMNEKRIKLAQDLIKRWVSPCQITRELEPFLLNSVCSQVEQQPN